MFSSDSKKPLSLDQSIVETTSSNQIQQLKSVGNQPRTGVLSPNVISNTNAPSVSTPSHVSNVRVQVKKVSDVTSKVTVSFTRNPNDFFFSQALVHVSGYKGNPAPTQVASGQSPISFALENTGEPVSVKVQSTGSLGPAPLSTAPNATLQLRSTNLATTTTASGTGITSAALGVIQSSLSTDCLPRPTTSRFALWQAATTSGTWVAELDTFTSSTGAGGGSSSIAPTAAGGQATQGTNNVNWLGARWIWPGRSISFLTTALVVVTATSQIYWGMTAAGGGAVPTTADFIGVGVASTGSAAGNWLLLTSTGGSVTSVDSGIAVTQSVRHTLKVTVAGGVATLYLDGVAITSNSTLPTANPLSITVVGKNSGGSGLAFNTEYVYAENPPQ